MDEFLTMASAIYESAKDMDFDDYEDTKEESIQNLASALDKVSRYATYNNDFYALFNALEMIFGEV